MERSIKWLLNPGLDRCAENEACRKYVPPEAAARARHFHRQIPGYRVSPLKGLSNLAAMVSLGGIWVKDESQRLSLNSFKVLGGSFAIYRYLLARLGAEGEVSYSELVSERTRRRLGDIVFAAATDGNHGRGVAGASGKLGFKSVIYVHRATARVRIEAIRSYGAEVKVVEGTYDDAVRQITRDAAENGWQVISDTSWEGYRDIPSWVMQGYTTMFAEAQEELAAQGLVKPTHIFVQAGVGALAASVTAFYRGLFGAAAPAVAVVEPDRAACLYESARAGDGKPHSFPGNLDTIMAGLACGDPSPLAWEILRDCADVFIACPDYIAALGMRVYGVPLADDPFIVSGESGAVTLGALLAVMKSPELKELKEALRLDSDSQVLLLNTEGNTDPDHFRRVVWMGSEPVPQEKVDLRK